MKSKLIVVHLRSRLPLFLSSLCSQTPLTHSHTKTETKTHTFDHTRRHTNRLNTHTHKPLNTNIHTHETPCLVRHTAAHRPAVFHMHLSPTVIGGAVTSARATRQTNISLCLSFSLHLACLFCTTPRASHRRGALRNAARGVLQKRHARYASPSASEG